MREQPDARSLAFGAQGKLENAHDGRKWGMNPGAIFQRWLREKAGATPGIAIEDGQRLRDACPGRE